ncbi:toluene monooxygenase [Labrys monachus]|uniref:Toluene monooxygenase system protein E n=1 Tax=Labrys monachus TaxID=217067 RepID=A0ABU0F6Y4_9HYPH|nr:toluene monooxygenase [Labrys monachus]MDQ0390371.1 toluene monooxygenase system protein E [Labrys monachus]
MPEVAQLRPLKTWSHLAAQRRRPSEYEIVSTNLLWHTRDPDHPWDVDGFMGDWYTKNLFGSPLKHKDWNAFRDPDETVYRTYNIQQDGQESYVDGLLEQFARDEHDAALPAAWVPVLAKLYTPLRYPLHAIQMNCGYLASISPASTISGAAMFQGGDALRWLSRIAYRTRELANAHPDAGFARDERKNWETAPEWQGFRELAEKMLATYDWGQNFFVMNTIFKPALEEAALKQLALGARRNQDALLPLLTEAQLRDSARSQRWTSALIEMAMQEPSNSTVLNDWEKQWVPLADKAISTYCDAIPDNPTAKKTALANMRQYWASVGLAA